MKTIHNCLSSLTVLVVLAKTICLFCCFLFQRSSIQFPTELKGYIILDNEKIQIEGFSSENTSTRQSWKESLGNNGSITYAISLQPLPLQTPRIRQSRATEKTNPSSIRYFFLSSSSKQTVLSCILCKTPKATIGAKLVVSCPESDANLLIGVKERYRQGRAEARHAIGCNYK